MTQSVRLAIVDDHPLLREGVARSLAETGAFEICGEGASADDAIRLAGEIKPDILLIDISMPGGGLVAAANILARSSGQTDLYSLPWSWIRYVAESVFCPVSSNFTPR